VKKALSYIFIIFGLVLLWASTSRTAMKYISDKRGNDKWWGVGQLNQGDLASMSGLYFLHKFYAPEKTLLKRAQYNGPKKTVLFIHGDSYLWRIANGDSVFAGISSLHYIGWSNTFHYHLDTAERNILIIEVSERLLRAYYGTTEIIDELCDTTVKNKRTSVISIPQVTKSEYYSNVFSSIDLDHFFNKYINQNLQCNLFNYNFMQPLFGSKAAINYYFFNRASGDVVISDNKEFLLFKETIGRTGSGSSFSTVSDEELDHLINNFNIIYDYYRGTGFREVYLSIIPNTATIVQPKGYNNLIPSIQNDPKLKMKIIDIYSAFKPLNGSTFRTGDTHWNNLGKQMWFDMVNRVIVGDML
jgi:hypothetical protein